MALTTINGQGTADWRYDNSEAMKETQWNEAHGTDRGNRANMSVFLLLFIVVQERMRRRFSGAWSSTTEAFAR